MKFVPGLAALAALTAVTALAADWPQFRGANHDSTSTEQGLTWPVGGPKVIWRMPMGEGFSAISVVKDTAYCFVMRGEQEVAVAMDAASGKERWSTPIDKAIHDWQGGDGPRSTPSVDGDRVYIYSTYCKLCCLAAADGKMIWSHDLLHELGGDPPGWGNASSPMIDGNLLFLCFDRPGQGLMAFDKSSGQVVWKGQDDRPTHATPVPATIGGVRQVIFLTNEGLVSVEANSGHVLWRYSFHCPTVAGSSPVVADDLVYCSSAYGVGAAVVKISASAQVFSAQQLWRSSKLQNHWTTPVVHNGFLYGLYETRPSTLKCVEMATGRQMWSQRGFEWGGATVLMGDNLLVQDEGGALVLVEASPAGYHELGREKVMNSKSWTMPAISGGRIFTRNVKEAVCLDVSGK